MTVAVTDSPGTAAPPARNRSPSTSVHIPGPRNRTNPARDSASSCRTRKPGGPLATALKKLCHHPMSRSFERAVSAPSVTSGVTCAYTESIATNAPRCGVCAGSTCWRRSSVDVRAHLRLQVVERSGAHAVERAVERGEVDVVARVGHRLVEQRGHLR